jgi:uncharacterized integral membrane protein
MHRVKKIVSMAIFVPLAVVLIVLCVANRQTVTLALNPFSPSDTVLSVSAPFFLFLFVAILVGMMIGSVATWLSQGKYRRQARIEARAALSRMGATDGRKQPTGNALQLPAGKA